MVRKLTDTAGLKKENSMKKFLIPLFMLISFTAGACFAQDSADKQTEYKTLKHMKEEIRIIRAYSMQHI